MSIDTNISLKKIKSTPINNNKIHLPSGEYRGFASGYRIQIRFAGGDFYEFSLKEGFRGIDIPVSIEIKNGMAYLCQ